MRRVILDSTDFRGPADGWRWPPEPAAAVHIADDGALAAPPAGGAVLFDGPGVHARAEDAIELHFQTSARAGSVALSFAGGFEHLGARIDPGLGRAVLFTSECARRQPVAVAAVAVQPGARHVLRIARRPGAGGLVRRTDAEVLLDGHLVLEARSLDVLPEMGVSIRVSGGPVLLRRFVHRGVPWGVPERLHVGGWQMPNVPDIAANLASIRRGLRLAAERGVRLLLTPETSLTGLFANNPVTRRPGPVAEAERRLRRSLRELPNAPLLVVGLPVWRDAEGGRTLRLNGCRVYDGDGHVLLDAAKAHSCEPDFGHGGRLAEFDADGVPVCMHVCHDGRYPELWTLPIMFGARLVLHPSNSGPVRGGARQLLASARGATATMHAFYLRANGGGGSVLVGPRKTDNLIACSTDCGQRENPEPPDAGPPAEGLIHADIRVHDAFGYWPVRSFRTSEEAAAAYVRLYRSLGGKNPPDAGE